MQARRARGREIGFAVAAALLVLAAVELAFRAGRFGRGPYDDIYDVAYGMRPWAINPYSPIREQINRRGFRGAAYPEAKPKGTFRIVCLGDSCTFGDEVKADEAYPHRLETILAQALAAPRVEVINGGVPGTSLYQHVMVL